MSAVTNPTASETRPAWRRRLRRSRPSSSAPSTKPASPGRANFLSMSMYSGSGGATHGAKAASATRSTTPTAPAVARRLRTNRRQTMDLSRGSAKADARIGDRVEDVGEEAARDDHHRGHEQQPEDHRVVLIVQRIQIETPDAGPREHGLGDERAAEEGAELEPGQRDQRDERVAERVTQQHRAPAQPLGVRRADVVLAHDLEDARPRVAAPRRRHPEPEHRRGADEMDEAIPE